MRAAAAAQTLRTVLRLVSARPAVSGLDACSTLSRVDGLASRSAVEWGLAAWQQRAGFAAGRVIDTESIEDGLAPPKSPRRHKSKTRPKPSPEVQAAPKAETDKQRLARQERIRHLLHTDGSITGKKSEAAQEFVDSFFAGDVYQGENVAGVTTTLEEEEEELDVAAVLAADEDGELAAPGVITLSAPSELTAEEEESVLAGLQGLKRGSQRIVLQSLLQGKILDNDPEARREWAAIEASFAPPSGLRMRVVDINRTSKGTRAGGLYRFGAMVVVGNGEGVLGWGQGKAAELQAAVKKAYARACSNLFPIPRYNEHTVPEAIEAKFGQVKLVVYPKSAGSGIVASEMIGGICKMAGIHDIGVKVHGSRNRRNAVKCLFEAFNKIRSHEEIVSQAGKVVVARPPGRYATPRHKA